MHIFIPTYGRSNRQVTYDLLPESLRKFTTLVVQHRERELYKSHSGVRLVLPRHITTVAPTRQYIMEYARTHGLKKIVMLDDDLRFFERRSDDRTKFEKANDASVVVLFNEISRHLDAFAHVGVLAREGGNRVTEHWVTSTRMTRVLAYHVPNYFKEKIRFDRLPLQEDFDVTLQLLRKGHPNIVLADWVHDQGSSNAAGGCSHFRTIELHNNNAKQLALLHPGIVKVVTKQTKTAWGGQERLDVVVQWKKAFAEGKKNAR